MRPLPLIALVAALLAAGAVRAEPLGRLFFTPERRAALERQRQLNIQEAQTLEGATMSLDGVVVRSSGRSTVWVNQRPQNEGAAAATGVAVSLTPQEPGRAVLAPGEETPAALKVGESINRATRETRDGLGGGTVNVGRPAGAR